VALARDYGAGEAREAALASLLERTRAAHEQLSAQIARGRDRLLELASGAQQHSGELLAALKRDDADASYGTITRCACSNSSACTTNRSAPPAGCWIPNT
jgi:hypothetical protein